MRIIHSSPRNPLEQLKMDRFIVDDDALKSKSQREACFHDCRNILLFHRICDKRKP